MCLWPSCGAPRGPVWNLEPAVLARSVTCGSQAGSEATRWVTLGHWVWRPSLRGLKEGWPLCGLQGTLFTVCVLDTPLPGLVMQLWVSHVPCLSLGLLICNTAARAVPSWSYRGCEVGSVLFNAEAQRADCVWILALPPAGSFFVFKKWLL